MAVVYGVVVIFDFILFPLLWIYLVHEGLITSAINLQWTPITLASGGFFHIAMGGVIGVSAFTRGQEKVERVRTSSTDYTSETE